MEYKIFDSAIVWAMSKSDAEVKITEIDNRVIKITERISTLTSRIENAKDEKKTQLEGRKIQATARLLVTQESKTKLQALIDLL